MEFITYETEGAIGVLTINRPKALNALNSQVLEDLDAALDAVDLNAALEEELGHTIHTSPLTHYNGALGAALFAYQRYLKEQKG